LATYINYGINVIVAKMSSRGMRGNLIPFAPLTMPDVNPY